MDVAAGSCICHAPTTHVHHAHAVHTRHAQTTLATCVRGSPAAAMCMTATGWALEAATVLAQANRTTRATVAYWLHVAAKAVLSCLALLKRHLRRTHFTQAELAPPSAAAPDQLPVRMWSSGKYALFNLVDTAAPPPPLPAVPPRAEAKGGAGGAGAGSQVALAISGDLVASGGGVIGDTGAGSHLARLWDARSCRCLARLPHAATVTCIALDRTAAATAAAARRRGRSLLRPGVRLATGSADGTARPPDGTRWASGARAVGSRDHGTTGPQGHRPTGSRGQGAWGQRAWGQGVMGPGGHWVLWGRPPQVLRVAA